MGLDRLFPGDDDRVADRACIPTGNNPPLASLDMSATDRVRADEPLSVAYLTYRGKPHVGGQGVYTRHLAKALVDLGHHVEVL